MIKLQWNSIGEHFYDCLLNGEIIGQLCQDTNYVWHLEIPGFNIHNYGQYRHDLMEYAEVQLNKLAV